MHILSGIPLTHPPPIMEVTDAPLELRQKEGKIWSPLRNRWLVETPEELVRQAYLCTLVNEYGYVPAQMDEEIEVTGRGSGGARADFVIWKTAEDKRERRSPLVVVECKADNVTISEADYKQGELYARQVDAPFFVTHNTRETKFWRVRKDRMPGYRDEIENIPHAKDTQKEIEALLARLKTFKEKEFADLLHRCHNVIRNGDHLDPADAFDEIAKILFVKVYVERDLREQQRRENRFTLKVLDQQIGHDPINTLFQHTKTYFRGDRLFDRDARINLKPSTSREIVRLLEAYNLSDTREDVKGIAFERFLGRTFRGENLGQFFTPRAIVEFMIRMVAPREGDVICDPACGSGGFLIRFFALVRDQILRDVAQQYEAFKTEVEVREGLSEEEKAGLLRAEYDRLQQTVDQHRPGSRLWKLANRCIYGTDANERAARAAKMNMIMHGDGHGGVPHHNGFLNVNGVFEQRFDVILTNPPFGANVEKSAVVTPGDVRMDPDDVTRYEMIYGEAYREARGRAVAAEGKPIAKLFDLGTNEQGGLLKQKSEILFIERCLDLLTPGGRLGIVLPEGVFNNPSLQYVRDYCEDCARLRAVVSLPQEAFYSTGASVKASLLFLEKFTGEEQARYDAASAQAREETAAKYAPEIAVATEGFEARIAAAKAAKDKEGLAALRKEQRDYERAMAAKQAAEARALLKRRFPYHVFLYDADHVGITATGEVDYNELFPNDNAPPGLEATCLELYRRFEADPAAFLLHDPAGEAAA